MEKLLKVIIASFISLGGASALSQVSQSETQDQNENISITVTPNRETFQQTENVNLENARKVALNKISGTVKFEYEDEDYTFIIEKENMLYEIEVDKIEGYIDDVDVLSYDYSITYDQAKSIALSKVNGTIKEVEIDHDEYKFKIEKENILHKVELESYSGQIKETERKSTTNKSSKINLEEAKKIALKEVNGTIKYAEEDDDEYNIFIEKNQYLYEIEIDKYTGQVEDIDQEKISSQKVISYEDAKAIALKKINGNIKDMEYDDDDMIYEIEIIKDREEYEIEIDGVTGNIISVEKDD